MTRENKRGDGSDLTYSLTVFLILMAVMTSASLYYLYSSSSITGIYERAYSKQIALILNSAKPGTEIKLEFDGMREIAAEHKYNGAIVSIKPKENLIFVQLSPKSGYSYQFFTDLSNSVIEVDQKNRDHITIKL